MKNKALILLPLVSAFIISALFVCNKHCKSDSDADEKVSSITAETASKRMCEDAYLEFVKSERENPQYTRDRFTYAVEKYKDFEYPVLLLKDSQNLYLFYFENGKVNIAKDRDGNPFSLNKMYGAYSKNNEIYSYGLSGSPICFYYCKIDYSNGGFALNNILDGHYRPDSNPIYYANGTEISEEEYKKQVELLLADATKIEFIWIIFHLFLG